MQQNISPVSDFFSFSYLTVLGYRRDSVCDRVMLVLRCCNYLCKTELRFKLNHCTQVLVFAVLKSCVSGPAFVFFLFQSMAQQVG